MNRAITWFAHNPVAANLLMLVILVGGAITVFTVRQEVFPEFSTDTITVTNTPFLVDVPFLIDTPFVVQPTATITNRPLHAFSC